MKTRRPIPPAALALIRRFEAVRLVAYLCPAGVLTIGYGHTGTVDGAPIRQGLRISQPMAEALLAADAGAAAATILDASRVPLTDGQFGALTSFAFNLGAPALLTSTLWRKLQAGDAAGAAAQFEGWTKAGRPLRVLPGLVSRRAAERTLFLSKPTPKPTATEPTR